MTAKEDGGPAFPTTYYDRYKNPAAHQGMSLRDYHAARALAGMHARNSYDEGQRTPEQRAALAYLDADAMIAERSK